MKFKMENPDKVRNIVTGSYQGLCQLYGPGSHRMQGLVTDGVVRVEGEDVIVSRLLAE